MDPDNDGYAERLIEAIRNADVVSVFFFRVGQSLIMDLRPDVESEPLVTLAPMVETAYQRLISFSNLRPTLALPDEITLAPWPDRVKRFQEAGVLAVLADRCRSVGGEELAAVAEACFERLLVLERTALRNMVRGVGMETVWQRDASVE
jgi:hypothetical protein